MYVYTNVFVSICMKFSRAIQKRAFNGMKSKASLGNEAPGFSTASGNDGTPCAQHDANASSAESHFPCTLGTLTAHHRGRSENKSHSPLDLKNFEAKV